MLSAALHKLLRANAAALILFLGAPHVVAEPEDGATDPETVLLETSGDDELFSGVDGLLPAELSGRTGNKALIRQVGDGENATYIRQNNSANLAISLQEAAVGTNLTGINQLGFDNLALSQQIGSDNSSLVTQHGQGNALLAQQMGDNNVLNHTQIGDNLGMIVRQYGGAEISITQTGMGQ